MPLTETIPPGPAKPLTADDLVGDLIQPGHPLFGIVWVNRERMSGTPCFAGSRVPIQSLFDHLEAGDSLADFLADFPPVTRDQTVALLEISRSRVLDELVWSDESSIRGGNQGFPLCSRHRCVTILSWQH